MAVDAVVAANAALGLICVLLSVLYLYLRRQVAKDPTVRHQVHAMKRDTAAWALPYSELQFGRELGKGSQGEVFAALLKGTEVAVKRVDTSQVDPEVRATAAQLLGGMTPRLPPSPRRPSHPNHTTHTRHAAAADLTTRRAAASPRSAQPGAHRLSRSFSKSARS